jgi:hypothetical protein
MLFRRSSVGAYLQLARRPEAPTLRWVRPDACLLSATGPLLSSVGIVRIGIEKLFAVDFITGDRALSLR